MPGAKAATRKNGPRTLVANSALKSVDGEVLGRAPQREPGVVDEDVDLAGLLGERAHVSG